MICWQTTFFVVLKTALNFFNFSFLEAGTPFRLAAVERVAIAIVPNPHLCSRTLTFTRAAKTRPALLSQCRATGDTDVVDDLDDLGRLRRGSGGGGRDGCQQREGAEDAAAARRLNAAAGDAARRRAAGAATDNDIRNNDRTASNDNRRATNNINSNRRTTSSSNSRAARCGRLGRRYGQGIIWQRWLLRRKSLRSSVSRR